MDVFMIPIGTGRYALYCEQRSAEEFRPSDGVPPSGLVGRVRHKFVALVRELEERERQGPDGHAAPRGAFQAARERVMAWASERIAEQRLLWNLRGQSAAVVIHPQDMTFDQVMSLVHRILEIDYARHRKWLVLDAIAFVITFVTLGPLFLLIPGIANIPALYFGFRAIGHALSMRGAQQGLRRVAWSGQPSPPLTELRGIASLDQGARDARVHDVAARLRLQHLSTFVERVSLRHA